MITKKKNGFIGKAFYASADTHFELFGTHKCSFTEKDIAERKMKTEALNRCQFTGELLYAAPDARFELCGYYPNYSFSCYLRTFLMRYPNFFIFSEKPFG